MKATDSRVKAVLPKTVGDVIRFVARGNQFLVKKARGHVYTLWTEHGSRCRFGNRTEIAADVAYCMEFGVLPSSGTNTH